MWGNRGKNEGVLTQVNDPRGPKDDQITYKLTSFLCKLFSPYYGLNHVFLKFICLSPNPQCLKM